MQIKVIIRWIVVFLLQMLLFNNLQFWGLCQPQIYVLCLLMMPIVFPRWADMLIGFAVGLLMDVLCNSIGVHIAASVFLMYLRQPLIASLVQEHERLTGEISWLTVSHDAFIKYVVTLVCLHQMAVSMLTAWSFQHFGLTVLQIIISAGLNIGLILGYNFIRK